MVMELSVKKLCFYDEKEALPGVRRVAGKLRRDIERVFDLYPDSVSELSAAAPCALIYGTVGHSPLLDRLDAERVIDLKSIKGKREVYLFRLVKQPVPGIEQALVIAGSDKRGTMYGLFRLSELIGVSPLVDWAELPPAHKDDQQLDESVNMVSKEPSVKFRGLFINDEWPAFGNWCNRRFGGFNAAMYEHVFELILRHRGNFMWPAMWTSSFSCDGPGLAAAELADEYGIVIGTSHHEPCVRHGEEYSHVRGPQSPYGDAWDFRANREGIIRFWRDGLRRNKQLDNIITLGMRGERDSAILGKDSALSDNIALLRDVINTQNELIRAEVNPNLSEVPRCLVMFTEVEHFYHGTADTPGLKDDPCLDGVTLMLCDDNFGNIKSMPRGPMKEHKGGFGLYYHFDFHGGPTSYEWTNSSYLPKVWEQLTMAYESGVREVWVVNVGDLMLQEFPLSYYFNMAFDMEQYGASAPNNSGAYTEDWVKKTFGGAFDDKALADMRRVLDLYTLLNHNRKPELCGPQVYHPVHYGEASGVLQKADEILLTAKRLLDQCPEEMLTAFWGLIYYNAAASANLQKMMVLAGRNAFYAAQNRVQANSLADEVSALIRRDRELTDALHKVGGGHWYGAGLSEHIGFVHWLEECNHYPPMIRIEPANKPRLIAAHANGGAYTEGLPWTGKPLVFTDFLRPDTDSLLFELAQGGHTAAAYEIHCDCPWLSIERQKGLSSDAVTCYCARVDRGKLEGCETAEAAVTYGDAKIVLRFVAENTDLSGLAAMTFLERDDYICMDAVHFAAKGGGDDASFVPLSPYGRTGSAMAAAPFGTDFTERAEKPWLEYRFEAASEGSYQLELFLSPSNPLYHGSSIEADIAVNGGDVRRENTTGSDFRAHSFQCKPWVQGTTENIRVHKTALRLQKGVNTLRIYAVSPALTLERLLLYPADRRPPESYLGPRESYYVPCYKV